MSTGKRTIIASLPLYLVLLAILEWAGPAFSGQNAHATTQEDPEEFLVNDDFSSADQGYSDIAVDGIGNFWIVWQDNREGDYSTYAQYFAWDGERLSPNSPINDDTEGDEQNDPHVGVSAAGYAKFVWQDFRVTGYPDNPDIYGQDIDADGSMNGSNHRVNSDYGQAKQRKPNLDVSPAGAAIVVWEDYRLNNWDVYAQWYAVGGTAVGGNVKVNDDANSAVQHRPFVAADGLGNVLICWYDDRNGDDEVYGQIYNSSRTKVGVNFMINDAAAASKQKFPAAAGLPGGGFVVTWIDYRNGPYPDNADIYAQIISPTGIKIGSNFRANSDGLRVEQSEVQIGSAPTGGFVICWRDERSADADIYAQRYDPSGAPAGGNFMINAPDGDVLQSSPAVAMSDAKMYFTWTDNRNGGLFDIYGKIITYDNPAISPIPSYIYFAAEDGGPNPATQQLVVTNAGAGVLEWAAVDNATWLSLSQNYGTAPTTINLLVNISGLAIGNYSATITFTDMNDPEITGLATVDLFIDYGKPIITVSPLSLEFEAGVVGAPPPPQQIQITNTGGKTLNWQHSTSAPWIILEPAAGTAPSTPLVSIDPSTLQVGTYQGTLSILDPSSYNKKVDVTITCEVIDNAPEIALSATGLEFTAYELQGNPPPQEVEITNSGFGDLEFTVQTGTAGLLDVSPASGTAPQTIEVLAFTDTLNPGDYRDTIVIIVPDAKNSPVKLPVNIKVWAVPPEIQLSESAFLFSGIRLGSNPAPESFQIANSGGGDLHWQISHSSAWLTCTPESGTGAQTITCQANIAATGSGEFSDVILVTDVTASNSPQTIAVTLNIDEPDTMSIPTIDVVPGQKIVLPLNLINKDSVTDISLPIMYDNEHVVLDSAVFSGSRIAGWMFKSVFTDPVAGTVKFFATSHAVPMPDNPLAPGTGAVGFLHFTVSGSAPGGTIIDVDTITLDLAPLSLGNTRGTAFVPRVEPGGIRVSVPPQLVVAPAALSFAAHRGGPTPAAQQFSISNAGGGTLDWTITKNVDWLMADPDHGGNNQNVTCTVNQAGLSTGTHSGNITINDPLATNSPQTVTIQLTLDEADTLTFPVVDGLPGQNLAMPISLKNIDLIEGLTIPLAVSPTYVRLDSVSFAGTRISGWTTHSATVDSQNGKVVISGSSSTAPLSAGNGTIAVIYAHLTASTPGGMISSIDTATVGTSTLSFVSNDQVNFKSRVIPGRIQATQSPQISLIPGTLNFAAVRGGSTPANQQFTVANIGAGTLSWTATVSSGWISVTPSAGGNGQSVTCAVNTSTLTSGQFNGSVTITDPAAGNSPQSTLINLNLDEPDTLILPVVSAEGGTNIVIPINLRNVDNIKQLVIPIAVNPTYIRLDSVSFAGARISSWVNRSGTVNATAGTVVVSGSSTTPLAPGNGTLSFIHAFLVAGAPGGLISTIDTTTVGSNRLTAVTTSDITAVPRVVQGRVQAAFAPEISLNPSRLNFSTARNGPVPATRQFIVGNSGGGTLTWSATASSAWLSVNPLSGGANQAVTCVVDNTGMSVGTYYASAVISASAAVNSPRHVTIVLSVIEPDSLVIPDVDAEPAQEVIVPILLSNVDQLKALTLPLAFDPTYVFLDSASFIGSRIAGWPAKAVAVNNQLGTAVFSGNSPSAPLAPGSGIIGHVFLHVYPDIAGLISMDMDTTSIGQTTLAVIDTSGTTIIPSVAPGQLHIAGVTGIVNDSQSLNHELPGLVNYPNPFNSETVLIIRGQISADTRLVIYDVLGRVLCDLSGKIGHTGGTNRVIWDGTNDAGRPLGSGIYFAMLRSAHDYVTQKIVLLR